MRSSRLSGADRALVVIFCTVDDIAKFVTSSLDTIEELDMDGNRVPRQKSQVELLLAENASKYFSGSIISDLQRGRVPLLPRATVPMPSFAVITIVFILYRHLPCVTLCTSPRYGHICDRAHLFASVSSFFPSSSCPSPLSFFCS